MAFSRRARKLVLTRAKDSLFKWPIASIMEVALRIQRCCDPRSFVDFPIDRLHPHRKSSGLQTGELGGHKSGLQWCGSCGALSRSQAWIFFCFVVVGRKTEGLTANAYIYPGQDHSLQHIDLTIDIESQALWKMWVGMTTPSLLTIPKIITKAGIFLCITTRPDIRRIIAKPPVVMDIPV